ncbi:MAG: outer membrane lipoprotein LolB [Herminiimonas sp.]|nr:outer membrane lipoprotein LolB [Herminiimonas sp.]
MRFFDTVPARAGRTALAVSLLAIIVSGCASLPSSTPSPAAVTATTPARPYHEAIDLTGRLSLRYEQNGAPQALDGKFTWSQTATGERISLQTPFGQTLATIDVTPEGATLAQNGQPARSESSVDALTASSVGWPLPIAGLRTWLQGFATDARGVPYVASAAALGDDAFVNTADGWLIHYTTWDSADSPGGDARPRRIDLQRQTSQAGNIALRIVLDMWQPR